MKTQFDRGQTVRTKSGGPVMTIEGFDHHDMLIVKDGVLCVWFEGAELKHGRFDPLTLEPVSPGG